MIPGSISVLTRFALCIGKSKIFNHSFDITLLVDRNGLSGLVSLCFHHSLPPLAISKCCLIPDLNFITSKSYFDVTTMSSVATAIIVCSSPEHLKYTEWSTTECLKPKSFVMTAVSIFAIHIQLVLNHIMPSLACKQVFLGPVLVVLQVVPCTPLFQVAHQGMHS